MHIAAYKIVINHTLPALEKLNAAFWFLNASLQGILAPYHAVKHNPKAFVKPSFL